VNSAAINEAVIDDSTFRALFEQSPFSIQILSPEGVTLQVNQAWERLWGLTLEHLKNYNVLQDEQLVAKGAMPYIRRGFTGEAVAIPPLYYDPISTVRGGKRRWVRAFIYPIKDGAGRLKKVVLVHEDITHRMRSADALHKSREQLGAILDALSDCITVQDTEGQLVYANEAAARRLGFSSPAALLSAPLASIVQRFRVFDEVGNAFPMSQLPGRLVLQGADQHEVTLRFFADGEGEDHWSVVRAVPVFDAEGQVRFAINIFRDITERRRNENERQQLIERIDAERALLQAVLHQLPVGVLIVEVPSGRMMLGNEQFARIWRYPAETFTDYISFRQGKGFHPDGQPLQSHEWPLSQALAQGTQVHAQELQIARGDGTRGFVQSGASAVHDAAGNLMAAVVTLTDISERKEAEEKLRFQSRLLDTVGQSVVATDFEGNITYWNQAAQSMFGWTSDEVRGRKLLEFLPPPGSESAAREIFMLLQQGQEWRGEFEMLHRDGRVVPILSAVSPVIDETGRVVGMIGTSTDLTERKKAEEGQRLLAQAGEVLTSSLDYTVTMESVAQLAVPTLADWCAVDILSEEGTLQRLAVAHKDPEKAKWGFELSRRYPPDMDSEVGVPNVLRTGLPEITTEITDEILVQNIDDPELLQIIRELGLRSAIVVPLMARGRTLGALTFIYSESGRQYGTDDLELAQELARRAGLAVDNARLYQQAQRARESAEIANRTKDEFLATLSHELRTPLTAMMGWVDLMSNSQLSPEDHQRALEVIMRSTRTQAQLIEDLLDVSRIITGKLRVNVHPVELRPIVEAAVDTARPAASAKKIDLFVSVQAIPIRVAGDEGRLQQVVWNLLSNAVKFTPVGGRIEISLREVQGQAQIQVRDNGKGISGEFLPYVFERFRQADSSSTRRYGGLGLGLAIVRHLVEMHGGSTLVESDGENQGAVFSVILPLLVASGHREAVEENAPLPLGVLPQAAENSAAQLPPESGVRLAGMDILMVEDDEDARELLSLVLRREGALVRLAESADEAMELFRQQRPDVLISDIGMPGADGYDLIAQIRSLPVECGCDVPALALTAFARKEDRTRSLEAGFQEHLPKPVESELLILTIQRLAGRPLATN
jgi:PAS domain S-box-containing protein